MPFTHLAEATQTLYGELLDQVVLAEAEAVSLGLPPPGSFVSKTIRGRVYWYLQRMEAGRKAQYYLGADSPQLRRWMESSIAAREERRSDERRRAELVAMLAAGGVARPDNATARVLRALCEIGVFRLGGVLVGTHAFLCLANLLGVKFAGGALRTQDIDIAAVAVAVDPGAVPKDLAAARSEADPGFFPVPALDRGKPSTSFKVRGRDVRVDLLTPAESESREPVLLKHLAAAAMPLPFLGYLLEGYQPAVIPAAHGLLVNVPEPARFAWHKLWAAAERPSTEHLRSTKDIQQAGLLFEVLDRERPGDLERAWAAVEPAIRRAQIGRSVSRLSDPAATVAKRIMESTS